MLPLVDHAKTECLVKSDHSPDLMGGERYGAKPLDHSASLDVRSIERRSYLGPSHYPVMLKAVQITDLHLFTEPHRSLGGVDVDASLQRVLRHLHQVDRPVDLVLATGGVVHEETEAAYKRVGRYLTGLEAPIYCVPGNHDDKALLRATCERFGLRNPRRVLRGGWQLLMLDSAQPPDPAGHLAEEELLFLDQALGEYPHHPAVVVLHHAPLTIGSPWMDSMQVDNGTAFFAVLERYPQVQAVIFGHIHQELDMERSGVRFLAAPATCLQFTPGAARSSYDDRPPGYRWFRFFPDGQLETGIERIASPS